MTEVSAGMSTYQWSDYDKKIKASSSKTEQQSALQEALKDNKLTGNEIKELKAKYQEAFMNENPNESLDTADANFYSSLASVTGVTADKLRSADASPVEFTFNIANGRVSTITEDKNEDNDGDVTTTKEGGAGPEVFASNVKTPESLKFKDYKTNNFDDAAKVPEKGSDFKTGGVTIISDKKASEAVGGDVKAFQNSIGLTGKDVDGKFGPKTLSTLAEKYSAAVNANPPTAESKAEADRLGAIIDKLQPSFEGTQIGNDLKALRAETSPSAKAEETKRALDKTITDKREILKTAGDLADRGSKALSATPPNYAEFKKVCDEVKAGNLPESVKSKVMDQLGKLAEEKLTKNIGSPPAKNMSGSELIDALPETSNTKLAFRAMYAPDGKNNWTLKKPEEISTLIKDAPTEVASKILSTLTPKDSESVIKKMEPIEAKKAVDGMKPQDAAKIFNGMSAKDAASVLVADGQDKSKTSSILAAMDADKAKKVLEFTSKPYAAWTDAVKGQMTEDKAVNGLNEAINKPGEKIGTDHIDKINEKSSPKAQATKEAFSLLYDRSEKNGQVTWNPKNPPDKAKLQEFIQKPEFKQLSPDIQKLITDQAKPEEVKTEDATPTPKPAPNPNPSVQTTPQVKTVKTSPQSPFNIEMSHSNPYTKTSDPNYFSATISKKQISSDVKNYDEASVRKFFDAYLRSQGKDPAQYDIKCDWRSPNNSYQIEALPKDRSYEK